VPEAGCGLPSATGYEWEEKLTSRFDYDLEGDRGWGEKRPTQVDFGSKHPFPLVDSVRKRLFPGADARFGPVVPSVLGTTATTDASVSFFGGLNVFNEGKANSFGVKGHSTNRTGYREFTLLLDVDGDGISDLVVREGDRTYKVYRGLLDANGNFHFAAGVALT